MTKRMLIDATHAEETRVVVLDGNRLEDFDVETATKKQLKGNIYLAKVVRVEPSLQAAFVEYGGGRHGFLAFSEIHPDYYQIPVADRQRLLAMQEAEARAEEEADDAAAAAAETPGHAARADESNVEQVESFDAGPVETLTAPDDFEGRFAPPATDETEPVAEVSPVETPVAEAVAPETGETPVAQAEPIAAESEVPAPAAPELAADAAPAATAPIEAPAAPEAAAAPEPAAETPAPGMTAPAEAAAETPEPGVETPAPRAQAAVIAQDIIFAAEPAIPDLDFGADTALEAMEPAGSDLADSEGADFPDAPAPESTGGREDTHDDDAHESRAPARFLRNYKIQEVIRRRQILLVQVVKEERGSKGAALTTYISLAGRFSVLMPNSPRGGGISRKITSAADRRRLKEVTAELQIPRGMGLIVRTAGANRPKAEIRRDCEYLLELWDSIRETTMASTAPALIHEEANLIKRAIRDNYSRDVDEVLVDGEAGWRAARDFMRMLMPAHARKVQLWTQPQPLFSALAVEAQLDSMLQPTVQLRSGGYLVINQTEALVAIDVNSGRSTRERGIEETAIKTNLEAADEVARQLRLRDLAGLIVIDFIDMESRRNNAAVEKRMKDALKDDRARIQIGSISHFGLMEMSRQRLRPSLAETSFIPCPHCGGTGHVRSTETSAIAVLRAIEEEGAKRRAAEILVHVASSVALYILNHKRQRIAEIEARYGMIVSFAADESLLPPQTRIERLRAQVPGTPLPAPVAIPIATTPADAEDELVEEEEDETEEAPEAAADSESTEERDQRGRKRRRRRRGGRREDEAPAQAPVAEFDPALDPAFAEQPDVSLSDLPVPQLLVETAEPAAVTETAADATTEAGAEPPKPEAATEEEESPSRRRGRRGGRRRRRDTPETEAAGETPEAAEAPASFEVPAPAAPAYAGPTPADPFGGGSMFDIFDVLEQAAERATVTPRPAVLPEEPAAPVSVAEPAAESPAEPVIAEAAAEVSAAEPVAEAVPAPAAEAPATEAAPVETVAVAESPEPPAAVAAPEPPATAAPEPAVAAAEPAPLPNGRAEPAEPTATPGPAPVVIGVDTPATEKKRGWWRR